MNTKILPALVAALIICALIITALIILGEPAQKKEYIVGIDGDHLPSTAIILLNNTRTAIGFDVEAIQWIAEREGFAITFKEIPWSIITELLESGDIDMFYSGYSITEQRAERHDFSDPYYKTNIAIAIKKNSGHTREDFNNGTLTIGTQQGITSVDELKKYYGDQKYNQMLETGKIILYSSSTAGFGDSLNALETGKIDAIIYNELTISSYLPTWPNLTILDTIDTNEYYGIALKKGNTQLKTLLDKGLKEFSQSGKRAELLKKYHMRETMT